MLKNRYEMMLTEKGNRAKRVMIDTDEMVQRIFPLEELEDHDLQMLTDLDTLQNKVESLEFEGDDDGVMWLTFARDCKYYAEEIEIETEFALDLFKFDLITSLEGWWGFINEMLADEEEQEEA